MFGVSQIIHTLVDSSGGFCFFQVFQFVSSILDFFLFAKASLAKAKLLRIAA